MAVYARLCLIGVRLAGGHKQQIVTRKYEATTKKRTIKSRITANQGLVKSLVWGRLAAKKGTHLRLLNTDETILHRLFESQDA